MSAWHFLGSLAVLKTEAGEFRHAAYAQAGLNVEEEVNDRLDSGDWKPNQGDTIELLYVVIPAHLVPFK